MFFEHINSFHPTITFTIANSTDQLPFLDILISLKDGFLKTDIQPVRALTERPSISHNTRHCHTQHPSNQSTDRTPFIVSHHLSNQSTNRTPFIVSHHLSNQNTNRTPFIVTHNTRPIRVPTERPSLSHTTCPVRTPTERPSMSHTTRPIHRSVAGSRNSCPPSYTPAGECSRRPPTLPSLGSATASRCDHYSCRPLAHPTGRRPWPL